MTSRPNCRPPSRTWRKARLAANNYASSLANLRRFKETKLLLRRMMPVTRRVLGDDHDLMLSLRTNYALSLYRDPASTLTDLHEAKTTLEETERTARRVFGLSHPHVTNIALHLRDARRALRARETPSPGSA